MKSEVLGGIDSAVVWFQNAYIVQLGPIMYINIYIYIYKLYMYMYTVIDTVRIRKAAIKQHE